MAATFQIGTLIGWIVGWVVAITCLAQRKKIGAHYLLALFYFSLGIIHLSVWNIESSFNLKIPQLSEIDLPFACLLGPIIYFLYRYVMVTDYRFRPVHWVHFFPAVAMFFILLPFYLKPASEKQQMFSLAFTDFRGTLLQINLAVMGVMNLIYLFLVAKGTLIFWNWQTLKSEPLIRNLMKLMVGSIGVIGTVIAGVVLQEFSLVHFAMTLATIGHFFIFIQMQRNPLTYFQLQKAVQKVKYRRALSLNISTEELSERIRQLFEEKKQYRDPDLKLSSLAMMLSITPHQLSQFLNEHLGKSFARFLNDYRIAEAKQRLIDEADISATAIAYQLGFSNYTTFHLVFRRLTGTSPRKFREKHAK